MRLFLVGDTPLLKRVRLALKQLDVDVHEADTASHLLERVLDYRPHAILTDQVRGVWDGDPIVPSSVNSQMFKVNTTAAAVCGLAANVVGAHLYHVSDPYVFPGSRAYVDTDKPYPASVYGFTRALGEKAVRALHPNVGIVRVGWLYGTDIPESFPALAWDALAGRRSPVNVYEDILGSPTYVGDAAATLAFRMMQGVMELSPRTGTFHMASDLVTDWHTYLSDDFPVVASTFKNKISRVWHRNAALVPSERWAIPHGGLDRFRSDIYEGEWDWTASLVADK